MNLEPIALVKGDTSKRFGCVLHANAIIGENECKEDLLVMHSCMACYQFLKQKFYKKKQCTTQFLLVLLPPDQTICSLQRY